MMRYKKLKMILGVAFSIETDLDEEFAKQMYEGALVDERGLREEVCHALSDPNIAWKEMLANERYEIYEAESEEEARKYAHELLSSDLLRED